MKKKPIDEFRNFRCNERIQYGVYQSQRDHLHVRRNRSTCDHGLWRYRRFSISSHHGGHRCGPLRLLTFDFDMQTATSLRDSMPEEVASSKADEGYSKAPFTIYRLVNAAVLTLIAVAQISVIFQNGQTIQMCCSVKASSQAAKGQPWPGGKSSIESTLLFLHGFRGERGCFHFGKV